MKQKQGVTDLLSTLRILLFVLALVLGSVNGAHWSGLLFAAAALICLPWKAVRDLFRQLHVKEGLVLLLAVVLIAVGAIASPTDLKSVLLGEEEPVQVISVTDVPAYDGEPYAVINGNVPYFTEEEITAASFEIYGDLDALGRCTVCWASVGQDLMPTEPRGSIGSVKPTGWHTEKYDFVDGKYLYNRCHLIGFQLTAENANPKNLITGTRYLNVQGMLPFENMVADYVKETGYHVMYRVTPQFEGEELVARGVLMEAYSVEDSGDGVLFCVYCYNVQPGVVIDYATGESRGG